MAPSSPLSTVACQSASSARLPRPSGSALVCRQPSFASGLSYSSLCSALSLRILSVALAHRLSVSTSDSTTTCYAAVGWPPGVSSPSFTMAPLPVGSTMGRHHGCSLGPDWLLLLQVPSASVLAPPSIWSALAPTVSSVAPSIFTTLDSVDHPPPRCPSSARASTWTAFLPALCCPLSPSHI